jgi:hypothetical protein
MDQHVTYHPITDNLLRSYRYYLSSYDGAKVAADHCAAVAMDDALSAQFLGLLAHFAAPTDRPFDQTHGFNIALTQGFFGPYFYINSGQLSTLGHAIAPYTQPWQQLVPGWDMVATAQNRVLSRFSSGVFIPANRVAPLMSDAHTTPELAQALATAFPGEKLDRLWSALLYAHNAGAGLLEAASVVEPNAADLSTSVCFTNFAHCDQAGLQLYVSSQQVTPLVPTEPRLLVHPRWSDPAEPSRSARLPSVPCVTEPLRARRSDLPVEDHLTIDLTVDPTVLDPTVLDPTVLDPPLAHTAVEDTAAHVPEPSSEQQLAPSPRRRRTDYSGPPADSAGNPMSMSTSAS